MATASVSDTLGRARRSPRRYVAVEGLGHVGHHPRGDHRPGEVGPRQGAPGDLGGVGVADPAEALQPLADGLVALVPAPAGHLDGVGQVRLQQPFAVQQHVDDPVPDGGGDLAAGQHLDPQAVPGGRAVATAATVSWSVTAMAATPVAAAAATSPAGRCRRWPACGRAGRPGHRASGRSGW